jgi:hypothetical protein
MKFVAFLFAVLLFLLPMSSASAADPCLSGQGMMITMLPGVEWHSFGSLRYGIPADGEFLDTGTAPSARAFFRKGEQILTFGVYVFDPKQYQKENLPKLDRLGLRRNRVSPENFTRSYVASSAEKFKERGLEISCIRPDEDSQDYVEYRLDLSGENKFGQALYFYDRGTDEFGMLVVLAESRFPIDLSRYGIQKAL